MPQSTSDASQALNAYAAGDPNAASRLLPLVYNELRGLAAAYMKRERGAHTLQPTALVHEAYLRLVRQGNWQGETHFLAVAAKQMRRVLVEHARAHNAEKRGGGVNRVTLDDGIALTTNGVVETLALDTALERLARSSARQSDVFELRYFAGLSVQQTAFVLEVSERTVKEDWRLARARLRRLLSGAGDANP